MQVKQIAVGIISLTSVESNVGLFGIVGATGHPADTWSESFQSVHLEQITSVRLYKNEKRSH